MSICGIDVGTTGCKVVVFSLDGSCLAHVYREYHVLHSQDGWADLDSQSVWNLICDAIKQAAVESRHNPIEAISVSSLGEAMVPVTSGREILSSSILCSDIRGQQYVDQLLSRISVNDFYKINPNMPGIGYSMPKLRWIKDNNADVFKRTDWFLTWADFVCFMLGGDAFSSRSLAGRTLLYDLQKGAWSDRLLEQAGLQDIREKLAPVVASGKVVGQVDSNLANRLGLRNGVTIVSGGHDQGCNAFGAGVNHKGQAVYGIGTFACITPVFDELPDYGQMLQAGLGIEDHVCEGKYVTFIYNQAGVLVKWFRDTFAASEAAQHKDIYSRLDSEMPSYPTGLFTLPYFEPTGPPNYISNASGMIIGLKSGTKRGEILKSIMESVTFYLLDASSVLGRSGNMPHEFVVTGGGAMSDEWVQIKADIWGKNFIRKSTVECTALGAALLAGKAIGGNISNNDFVKNERMFEPDLKKHEIYQEKFYAYQKIVKKMLR